MNKLTTVQATTSWPDKGDVVHEVAFEDWAIDGVPLRTLAGKGGEPAQEMTRLCLKPLWLEDATRGLLGLLGRAPADFDDGRCALLVCPIDGDLGCTSLSAQVVRGEDVVEWRDFAWQTDLELYEGGLQPPIVARFDRREYDWFLESLLLRYRAAR
jgi:hypothetical protein